MKIAILSLGQGWHVHDLLRAARARNEHAELVDFRRLSAWLGPARDSLASYDAVLVRTMPPGSLEQVVFRMDVLQRCQARGGRVLNPPAALETCIDKYLANARLEAAGLPTPPTLACQDAEAALEGFHALGGDVVVKPLFGSEGRGMVRVSDPDMAWRIFRALERTQAVLYVQQFVPHPGWDLRVFVIGNRGLAGMRRHGQGSWRTNVAQGGKAQAVDLTHEEERLALAAARAVGTSMAGVDLLPRPGGGYYVLEVNAVPGWRALARATGIDMAAAILEHISVSIV